MDLERALISRIIATGQLEEVVSKGVREDHFADPECRDMFGYLTTHARLYKTPPSLSAVKNDRPKFDFLHVEEHIAWVTDRFIKLVTKREAANALEEIARALEDPDRAENITLEFMETSRHLATIVPSTKVALFSDMPKRIAEYERRVAEGQKTGVPFGFPQLDAWTSGIQPHEFVVASAFSGIGKSTLLMAITFNAYMQGYTPLIISLEMESEAILRKFDAMAAALDYQKMKQLDLSSDHLDNWRDYAAQMRERTNDIPVIDSIRNCTPDHIFAETVRHKPDLVVVDYLSLMRASVVQQRGSSIWQQITDITRELKQNARTLRIPILAAAQTNRSGARDGSELDNIGSSISIVQDADIVVGLFADDDMKEEKEMEIRLNKNRDGKLGRFRCLWDHENLQYREKTMKDLFKRDAA